MKFDLDRHCVCTAFVRHEKFAIAIELTIVKGYMVIVVITMKGNIKLVQEETILLFRITFCLLSFSDHSIVHVQSPFRIGK